MFDEDDKRDEERADVPVDESALDAFHDDDEDHAEEPDNRMNEFGDPIERDE